MASSPGALIDVAGTLFFDNLDLTHGYELWKSDGTAHGTVMVKDIRPGGSSSYPDPMVPIGSELFFRAKDATGGGALWKSDGTATGQ